MLVRDVHAIDGIADLGSQRQLAAAMGLSPGTVNQYVRRLGPIVVTTAPLRIDTDELGRAVSCKRAPNGTRWASRGPRPVADPEATSETPSPRPSAPAADFEPSSSPEDALQRVRDAVADLVAYKLIHRLQPVIDTFVDQFVELLDQLLDELVPPESCVDAGTTAPESDGCAARGTTARHNARHIDDEVPRGNARFSDSQSEVLVSEDQERPAWLTDPRPTTPRDNMPRAASSDVPRDAAPTRDVPRGALISSRTETLEALAPLFEVCRRNHLPADLDDEGLTSLRQLSVDELTNGVRSLLALIRTGGTYRRPLGFLVKKARTGRDFFAAPHHQQATPPVASTPEPIVDEGPDPLEGLSEEELVAIDATIKNKQLLPHPALMAMRRDAARELRKAQEPQRAAS